MTLPHHPDQPHRLRILFATVSGTAREIAHILEMEASDLPGLEVEVIDMLEADGATVWNPDGTPTILCVATTGSGDVPDDGQALYAHLIDNPAYLGGLKYGLVALGDSSYGSTFCGGGLHFETVLQDLGAHRIGEMLQLDAMEDPEPGEAAIRWFDDWKKKAGLAT